MAKTTDHLEISIAKAKSTTASLVTRKLRRLHAIGCDSLGRRGGVAAYGEAAIDEEAKLRKLNPDTLRKLRAYWRCR